MPNFTGLWTPSQQLQAKGLSIWPATPGAPTSVTATAGDTTASVAFTAPTDTGYPANGITGYTATSSPGGFTGTAASSPITVTGLTNGTSYTFTVRATNAAGSGPASSASSAVTPAVPNYIDDVFSTYLYTGTGASQTVTTGINASANGGLFWIKARTGAESHRLTDTVRGANFHLSSDFTGGSDNDSNRSVTATTTGFTTGSTASAPNTSGTNYVAWTFRKQPKFFDIVTWTGNGASPRQISHNLGSTPGCIIVKRTDSTASWIVWHRASPLDGSSQPYIGTLNSSDPINNSYEIPRAKVSQVSSTTFQVLGDANNAIETNLSGGSYIAYVFAHNAGGFGETGNDNVISCGSFTGNTTVNLGFEPQWILLKNTGAVENWYIHDVMRGWPNSGDAQVLYPNLSSVEGATSQIYPNSTGFSTLIGGGNYIYVAIRRPMKPPTVGTQVFTPLLRNGTAGVTTVNTTIRPDMVISKGTNLGGTWGLAMDRLRGNKWKRLAQGTHVEPTVTNAVTAFNNTSVTLGSDVTTYEINQSYQYANWYFTRAPKFFDVVCYNGTGSAGNVVSHNLGVAPELAINISRVVAGSYGQDHNYVYCSALSSNVLLSLNSDTYRQTITAGMFSSPPTSTTLPLANFAPNDGFGFNYASSTYLMYLFATCPGVSKVGSYTGTGALQTINCGFTSGARFILIKRADNGTGDWFTYDSVRGISSGNDPYLPLNSSVSNEVTGTNYVDTDSTGFKVTAAAPAGLNASGGTYIFLAIA